MAHKHQEKVNIQKLIERSEKARETITEARLELKNKFDVAGRVREAVTSDPVKLVGGSLVGGYLLKKIFFRGKRHPKRAPKHREEVNHLKKERGVLIGILGMFLALAKPAAKMYATKLIRDYFKKRLASGTAGRPAAANIPKY